MIEEDPDFVADLRSLLAAGRKIEAIKRYRERTGAGLAEAKQAVEALEGRAEGIQRKPADTPLEEELVSMLDQGQKIQAIKRYREETGVGLKEAKEAVEAIAAKYDIVSRSRGGCLGLMLFLLAALYWWVV